MKKIFFTLIMAALLSSCSSIDPDVDFKGKVDDDFMITLSRGEIPMSLSADYQKSYVFTKSYKNGKTSGDWKKLDYTKLLGFSITNPDVHILNGSSWTGYEKFPHMGDDYLGERGVANAWREYKQFTGYDKCQLRKCSFEYDPQNRRVLIDDKWYNVESATGDKIVLSEDSFFGDDKNGVTEITEVVKYVYTYYKKPPYFDPWNVDTYESVVDIMLGQIRIMKEYKGDVWTFNRGGKLNLAKLEEVLLAGKLTFEDLDEGEYELILMRTNNEK